MPTYQDGEKAYLWDATTGTPVSAASFGGGMSSIAVNRSGTVTNVSGAFSVPANASRSFLKGQNPSATASLAYDEFNGTAVINTSFTVPPLGFFSITTQNKVNFVASVASSPVALTEG